MRRISGLLFLIVILGLIFGGVAKAQQASLNFRPREGTVDSSVRVQGKGFSPNTFVRVFLAGELVAIRGTDSKGNFGISFIAREEGKISARDDKGKEAISSQEFKLLPKIKAEPRQTIVEKDIQVIGTGFAKNISVLIFLEGQKVASTLVDNRREFTVWFRVPMMPGGNKLIEIKGQDMKILAREHLFIRYQNVSLSPSQGRINSRVTLTGSGFPPNRDITVFFGGKTVGSAQTDSNGYLRVQFVVPPITPPGRYGIEVIGGAPTFLAFEVLKPNLILSSLRVRAGEKITIQVNGAFPYLPVRIFLDGIEITPQPVPVVGGDGTLKTEIRIPVLPEGSYTLKVLKDTELETSKIITIFQDRIVASLAPIAPYLVRVWGYESGRWKVYIPDNPELSDLRELKNGKGYYVLVSSDDCELYTAGAVIKFKRGWNLIGWIS